MKLRSIIFLSIAALGSPASGAPALFIVGQSGEAPAHRGPVQARQGQQITLHAVLAVRKAGKLHYYSEAPSLRIGKRRVKARRLHSFRELGTARFAWWRVEPHPHHITQDPPNPGNPAYSNAVLFGPDHGKWLGYDVIEVQETTISGQEAPSMDLRRVRPTNPKVDVHDGLGTMRYKVTMTLGSKTWSSPGAESIEDQGLRPSVFRVSYRRSDDLVGYLTSYFNVPNVFGSAGRGRRHQTDLYQGADCADVIIGAARMAGARIPYTSARGLRRYARAVTPRLWLDEQGLFELQEGQKGEPHQAEFGSTIKRGDIMLIDYVGFKGSPRSWDHVGVVSADKGKIGWFDGQDLLLHMGYLYGLTEAQALSEGPAIVQFLRFKASIQRKFTRETRRHR